MALATYTDLQAAVANWTKRTDLTSIIPDFVTLAESRIARDLRLRLQLATAALTCVTGSQTVTFPTGLLEFENLTLVSSPNRPLHVVTPELLDQKYPEAFWTGIPTVYAVVGNTIRLGPTPDSAYTINIDYYKRFDPLATTPTNWLLTNYPMVYLAATLGETALYVQDDGAAAKWESRYQAEVKRLQDADDAAVRSGSAMRVRTI
jgi:hypothetical protein